MLKNLKYVLLTVACAVLISLAVGGTLANTNNGVVLSIKQTELERAVQSQQKVNTDNLIPFQNGHQFVPSNKDDAVYSQYSQQWPDGSSDKLFADSMKNVIDKIVIVENDGTAAAHVRTWVAFEQGTLSQEQFESAMILNLNREDWTWNTVASNVDINGNTYLVMCATYKTALETGQISAPGLMQLALANSASELIFDIDSNGDGVYNVLVTSEAYSDDRVMPIPNGDQIPWIK